VRFWSGGEAYDFFGLIPSVVASTCIGAYPEYTEAIPVFTTSQMVEGPRVIRMKTERRGNPDLASIPPHLPCAGHLSEMAVLNS
jgi:hypothetical protein